MARGRLMTQGRLTDMLEFRVRGWDVVAANVGESLLAALSGETTRVAAIGHGRYMFELPLEPPPDHFIARLAQGGAQVLSLNAVRDTLEDLFVQQVSSPDATAHDRGLGSIAAGADR
jgi:hypothetical protein